MMLIRSRASVYSFYFLLLASVPLRGQVVTGSILGTVKDPTGAILSGATVTVTSPALIGGPSGATTSENGRYRFPALPPGLYTLRIALPAFKAYVEEGIRVHVGGTVENNVFLGLAAVAEKVTVSGEAPLVDTQKPGVSTKGPSSTS